MKEFSLDYLRCVKCCSKLDLDVFSRNNEIEEGILKCKNCKTTFPIIEKIPILWNDFSDYLAARRTLGGKLFNSVSWKMKDYVKRSLTSKTKKTEDITHIEEKWTNIYKNNYHSKFYSKIAKEIEKLPSFKLSLEYGCSIGIISNVLANSSVITFGVDRSFSAINIAKKKSVENLDYFVADLLTPIFGKKHFDMIVALNLLELVEPNDFLKQVSSQIDKGNLVISDPYDYDRGPKSVKIPLNEITVREKLKKFGFIMTKETSNPSNIPWELKINPRTTLSYNVDLVIAKK